MEKSEIKDKIINGPNGDKPLSQQQQKAVECEKKYIRVLAGAGAGKTETLTRRILYLLLYKDVPPEEIVAFTFTEKAAQSMKSRIYNRVGEIMGDEYKKKLGKMYVGTIHAYALRILQDYFGYGNYDVLDENQEMAFIMKRGWDIGILNLKGSNYADKCKKFVESVNVVYDELVPMDKLERENKEFYEVFKKYEKKLDKHHRLTFGRLIYKSIGEIEKEPDKLPKISHLIVDEYQDINHAQEKFIELLGKNASIMVVGDPRQTIYQWRGSDDQCFERFASEEVHPDTEKIVIPENRRSGIKIVNIGNTIANKISPEFDSMTAIRGKEGDVYVCGADTPKDEAKWVVDHIEKIVKEKNLKYSDFGILLRSMSTSAESFIKEFKRRGIPYIVGGSAGLFRREEAKAVGKLFIWLYKNDEKKEYGFWKDNLYDRKYLEGEDLLYSALDDWNTATGLILYTERDEIKEKLKKWRDNIKKYSTMQEVYHNLLEILKFKELDPTNKLNAAVMANLGRFSNLLNDYENAIRLGGHKFSMSNSNLKGLMWYILSYASTAYEERLSEDIRGIDAVQLTTIHQAKGLEWMIVFVPSLIEKRFPSSHCRCYENKYGSKKKMWLISRDLFPADRYDLHENDERRLFYVAVTRAKSTLVLSYFNRTNNNKYTTISRFLEEVLMSHPTSIHTLNTSKKTLINVDLSFSTNTDEEITTYEAGEIVDYTKCPYFYRLRHVWGYEAPLGEELGYGNALHFCLRRAVEIHKEKGSVMLSAILEVMSEDKNFYLPYAPDDKYKYIKEGAKKILMNYVSSHMDDLESVAEVEYRLEFPQKQSTLTGKVDVIINKDDEVDVREYKTSTTVTKPEQVALQVQLYALGLKPFGYNATKGSVVYLKERRIDPIEVSNEKLNEAREKAEKIIESIKNQVFHPQLSDFCEVCDYKNICKWYKKGGKVNAKQ